MSLHHKIEEAAERFEVAGAQVADLRARGETAEEDTLEWLEALSEMILALGDIQALNNESVHEKLHAMASRLGVGSEL